MGEGGSMVVGIHLPQADPNAAEVLQDAREDGYDFVTTILPHTQDARMDVTALVGRWWRTSVVGIIPSVASPDTFLNRIPIQLEWAMHMGIPAVILPPIPSREILVEYARKVNSLALQAQGNNVQLWIRVKIDDVSLSDFNLFHRLCDGIANIGIILIMQPMPTLHTAAASVASQIVLLHKAIGANLKAVAFPTNLFLTNKRGYPTLAKSHQVFFTEVLKRIGRTVRILVEGPAVHDVSGSGENASGATKCLPYLQYLRHMRQRPEVTIALDSEEATLERAYLDSLQRPLQPLKDHLEFSMYETFEKDPVKYTKYQEAIYLALTDGLAGIRSIGAPKLVTIAVCGAGRGPLVMRSIRAFQQLQVQPGTVVLKVYAVEKNPSAVVYLESMAKYNPDWRGIVTVVEGDARYLTPERIGGNKLDIVVSELLGSFGDNELSPECLDPVLLGNCCKPSTVSIPMQYTSFLAPVSSVRLHTEAKQQAQVPHEGAQPLGIQRAMETSYVVRAHAASQTHAEQPCWIFNHPQRVETKERAAHLEFAPDPTFAAGAGCGYGGVDPAITAVVAQAPAANPGPVTIHGLLGSFTAILYARGDTICDISIAPHRFSKDMFSWFPLYFPFHQPLTIPVHSNLSVSMWRKTKDNKVWYEWYAKIHRKGEIIDSTQIHNANGRSSYVSL